MTLRNHFDGNGAAASEMNLAQEPVLEETLRDFRLSVQLWSESVYTRPRQALEPAPRRLLWRHAAGWAMSCLLVAGLSGGLLQYHRQQLKVAQQRIVEHQRQAVVQQAQREELLAKADSELARVDSDVSQTVPSAMEPLAQLMAGDSSK